MGMDATATLSYCIELEEGDERFAEILEDGMELEDWWICKQVGIESLWSDDITQEQRAAWHEQYPCPIDIDYTGSYEYLIPIVYWKGSRSHVWWGECMNISPTDLEFSLDDHNEFIMWLKKFGIENEIPSWKMFCFYG